MVSVLLNVGIFVYARIAITKLLNIAEELWDLQQMVDSFAEHIETVYELETFYGDQTLQNLLAHAASFNKHLETFEHIYSLIEEEEDVESDQRSSEEEQT